MPRVILISHHTPPCIWECADLFLNPYPYFEAYWRCNEWKYIYTHNNCTHLYSHSASSQLKSWNRNQVKPVYSKRPCIWWSFGNVCIHTFHSALHLCMYFYLSIYRDMCLKKYVFAYIFTYTSTQRTANIVLAACLASKLPFVCSDPVHEVKGQSCQCTEQCKHYRHCCPIVCACAGSCFILFVLLWLLDVLGSFSNCKNNNWVALPNSN